MDRYVCQAECERYMQDKKRFNSLRFFQGRDEYFKFCEEFVKENPEYEDPYNAIGCFYEGYFSKTCPVCGKKIPVSHRKDGKDKVCSPECYRTKKGLELAKERRAATNVEKYGSLEEAYKYAHEQNVKVVMEKYGVPNSGYIPGIKEKREKTMIERYGAATTLQSDVLKKKVQETNLERYGHISAAASDVVREKIYNTNIERYGTKYLGEAEELIQKRIKTRNKNDFENKFEVYKRNWEEAGFEFVDFWTPTSRHFFKLRCKTCGRIVKQYNDIPLHCQTCNPIKVTQCEQKVFDLVKESCGDVEHNNRKIISPQELDIVVPEKNLAIEVNGVYWHSDRTKTEDYHMSKTKKASKKGYRVIHVYDVEISRAWCAVKSLILSALGEKPFSTDASECEVKQTDPTEAMRFAEKYNVKGYVESDINLGVFHKGRLVALAGFIRNRKGWTLTYNCELMLRAVRGYIGKVVRHLQEGEVTVNVDRRFSDGSEFIEAGFEIKNYSNPEPHFTNSSRMFYVPELTAEIVKKYKRVYDDQKTVEENICGNTHWARLWDCGRIKMTFKN